MYQMSGKYPDHVLIPAALIDRCVRLCSVGRSHAISSPEAQEARAATRDNPRPARCLYNILDRAADAMNPQA